jgi:dual specificity protein kinase YAK1
MLNSGKQTNQFFDSFEVWNPQLGQNEKKYRLKSLEQYSREHNTNEQPGKQYFKATSLPEIIKTAPFPTFKSSSRQGHEMEKELNNRASFIDFCQGLLDMNPVTRWTPQQARLHPFITGEKWSKPFSPDGVVTQQVTPLAGADPKRPYGGLVPSQPKGTRAYQDAATYNHQLAQHQAYTAQAQAASQAANNAFRNPYIAQQAAQAPPPSSYASNQESNASTYAAQQHQGQFSATQPAGTHRGGAHQVPSGVSSSVQYSNQGSSAGPANSHVSHPPSSSYYPSSRARANTINQVDTVPPALARLQHMNQDVISGRNALTPVLNRDDAMREWERRQAGKPSAAQPYPQLEYLQQQAELATSGLTNWPQSGSSGRYPPPSKLSHSYNPQTIMVDDDVRRDAVMSNVRSAARGDGSNAMYNATAVISSPPQAYNSTSTTTGNRFASSYTQQQAQAGAFDTLDRRTDLNAMFVQMQPEQYQSYGASNIASRHIAPPAQTVAPSFYGAGVVPTGPTQPRNPFSVTEGQQQGLMGSKDGRRGTGMDLWPR